jgi:hypothetical protein
VTVPPQWAKVHDNARRALVRAERSLAIDMRRTIRAIVAEQGELEALSPRRAAEAAARAMMTRLPRVILRGRTAARIASAKAIDAELRLATRLGVVGIPATAAPFATRDDEMRAIDAARGYAAAWLKAAIVAIDDQSTQDSL